MRCSNSTLRLQRQLSKSNCTLDASFGCSEDGSSIWVRGGCRARFNLGGRIMDCGFEGMGRGAHACALPSTDDSSYDPTTPCVCFAEWPKARCVLSMRQTEYIAGVRWRCAWRGARRALLRSPGWRLPSRLASVHMARRESHRVAPCTKDGNELFIGPRTDGESEYTIVRQGEQA